MNVNVIKKLLPTGLLLLAACGAGSHPVDSPSPSELATTEKTFAAGERAWCRVGCCTNHSIRYAWGWQTSSGSCSPYKDANGLYISTECVSIAPAICAL